MAEGSVWVHGNVQCPDCGYDSAEEHERHVWLEDARGDYGKLECPRCRSLRARGFHEVEDEDLSMLEFDIEAQNLPVAGFAVFRSFTPEGEPLTGYSAFGNLMPEEVAGMLQVALDQLRSELVDKSERGMHDVLGYPDPNAED